jgi:phospholipid/cholesterol/gamma-HCH transport system substrate-binding protein
MAGMVSKLNGVTRILTILVVLAVVGGIALVVIPRENTKYVTAMFPRTVSLYQGSDVRILGVPVGKVDSVTPHGTDVVVRMSYDSKYKVPADAKAVIVSPAIVGDRFVQLTPVYRHGPVMQDGARLTEQRTATPLELDQIYKSIDQLTTALGPQGANKTGALTHLLNSTAKNFAGQGQQFHRTIQNFGKLTGTLAHNKGALFGTARQLGRFVSALAKNDSTVRQFNDSLMSAAGVLKNERGDLSLALRNLGVAMQKVSSFVRENRGALSRNIKGLNQVVQILVRQRAALDETLTNAPVALTNLFHTYNPAAGTLDTRANVGENLTQLSSNPALVLCSILHQAGNSQKSCNLVKKAVAGLPQLPRTAPLGASGGAKTVQVEHIDRSLGGIVEVKDK